MKVTDIPGRMRRQAPGLATPVETSEPEQSPAAGLDLHGQDLRGQDLSGRNLRQANLSGCWLAGAELGGADLRHANLRDADLADARGLNAGQLGGALLRGARLPAAIARFEILQSVDRQARCTAFFLLAIMVVAVLALLSLAGIGDLQLFTASGVVRLPLTQGDVPARLFFRCAPFLLLALYCAFQLNLLRLQEAVAQLPAEFPDGRRADLRGAAWPIAGIARGLHHLRLQRPPLSWQEDALFAALSYCLMPLVLLAFWARYLVCRNGPTSALEIDCIVLALAQGSLCCALGRVLLSEGKLRARHYAAPQRYLPAIAAGALLFYLTGCAFDGMRATPVEPLRVGKAIPRVWFPLVLKAAGAGAFANLREVDGTERPLSWSGRDDEFALLHPIHLARADLRYADAWKAFLPAADLEEASMQHADFSRADLRHARLGKAHLQQADLIGADLRHADFTRANLQGANLAGARMQFAHLANANLSQARLGRIGDDGAADLSGAYMVRAELAEADLRGVNLHGADLQYADLTNARLQHANLNAADLRNSTMGGINLVDATYNHETQWPANFSPAQMGAKLVE